MAKKRFIYGSLFLIALALVIVISLPESRDEELSFISTDPNLIITLEIEPIITIYEPKEYLKDDCWVRALTKLAQIYKDPNITGASMVAGWCNPGYSKFAHAWIEYQHSNDIIRYDPTFDVYLKPYPKDANLLTPVIPKEPNEALEIIYTNQ